jgi:hypothetical protein
VTTTTELAITGARPSPPVGAAPGMPGSAPPPSVPLAFLMAAGVGLVASGLSVWFGADRIIESPTHPGAVSAVHVTVLAFLTTAVLGALHQFAPVIGRRPLRSVAAARVTLVGMVATGWLLPTGFAHGPSWLVPAGGLVGAATVTLAIWNLSRPLASSDGGLPARGLRISLAYLALTVAFGVVYAFDREIGWFPLLPHRVLAHAHLGLLGWLGLTYVAVAEKLWPMFLLAHRPSDRSGRVAVTLLGAGPVVLAVGLLVATPPVAWVGGMVSGAGLFAHLGSLAGCVRHRRRPLELLHAYLFTSAGFLVTAMVLAVIAGGADLSTTDRASVVAAEVAALLGWVALAVVGHAHKIVPFIGYTALRGRGIRTGPSGGPLLFADLFDRSVARVTLVLGATGFAAVVAGILLHSAAVVAAGAGEVAVCGALATGNLALGPRRVTRRSR